jgi:hypothetical protein
MIAIDAHLCLTTDTVTITQPAPLIVSASVTSSVSCYSGSNGSAISSASGGTSPYTYSWSVGGTNPTISGLTGGSYTVTLLDSNGCSASTSVTITQPNALSVSASVTALIFCNGGTGSASANVSGGTLPYSYSWSNTETTDSISGLSPGTYTINVTDSCGDIDSAFVTISQPTAVNISVASQTNVKCYGDSTGSATVNAASGGTSPYKYNWSPSGGTSLMASGISAGIYTITVDDSRGCTASASVTITQPSSPLLVSTTVTANAKCNDNNVGNISSNISGGQSPYTYLWTGGGTNASYSGLSGGTYIITVTDNNGCLATAAATIIQTPAMTVKQD